ncbi:MAG: ribose-phosphate pyrophosphokinase [Sandaracinaceae bacterium]|nr:ribose-phosphate pyrophosphokinase [Sandaracinaceae bacterium]
MELSLISGSANRPLADAVAKVLGVSLAASLIGRYPDGELRVEIQDSVRGHDVFLIQPTSPPAEEHLMVLLLLADACRRAGAARLTAVIPYFGYARQDRRAVGRQPVAARLVADLIECAGIERVVAVDMHGRAMEGIFSVPLEHLSAVPQLVAAVKSSLPEDSVVVASDLGATKLAERWARILDLPTALVHKQRVSGEQVTVRDITGDVRDRSPLLVDDMISTGGTLAAAAKILIRAGAKPHITVAATHGLLVGDAATRLAALPLSQLVVTDSVIPQLALSANQSTATIAPLLAEAIRRLYEGHSLGDLLSLG